MPMEKKREKMQSWKGKVDREAGGREQESEVNGVFGCNGMYTQSVTKGDREISEMGR